MQQVAAELQELIRRYFGAVGDSAADEDALVRDASAYQRLVAQLLSGPEACTEEDRDALARWVLAGLSTHLLLQHPLAAEAAAVAAPGKWSVRE